MAPKRTRTGCRRRGHSKRTLRACSASEIHHTRVPARISAINDASPSAKTPNVVEAADGHLDAPGDRDGGGRSTGDRDDSRESQETQQQAIGGQPTIPLGCAQLMRPADHATEQGRRHRGPAQRWHGPPVPVLHPTARRGGTVRRPGGRWWRRPRRARIRSRRQSPPCRSPSWPPSDRASACRPASCRRTGRRTRRRSGTVTSRPGRGSLRPAGAPRAPRRAHEVGFPDALGQA